MCKFFKIKGTFGPRHLTNKALHSQCSHEGGQAAERTVKEGGQAPLAEANPVWPPNEGLWDCSCVKDFSAADTHTTCN